MAHDEAGPGSAGGSASPDPGVEARRVVELLSEAESLALLAGGRLARLVYTSRYGLTALPVTYRVDGGVDRLGDVGSRPV